MKLKLIDGTVMARGDYGPLVVFAMSGLLNGFCWEMWNYFSMPSNPSFWQYDIPFLNAFYLFEMPLVGYELVFRILKCISNAYVAFWDIYPLVFAVGLCGC